MRRTLLFAGVVAWALGLGVTAWGITRINGNQLLEGTGEFGFKSSVARDGQRVAAPRLIYSVGQGVMARGTLPESASGAAFTIGGGLGYDIAHYIVCPISQTGDLNADGQLSAVDIVRLVRFIYRGDPAPEPCPAIADANCSGNVTAADALVLIGHVFRGDAGPCNVCGMIPDEWPCY